MGTVLQNKCAGGCTHQQWIREDKQNFQIHIPQKENPNNSWKDDTYPSTQIPAKQPHPVNTFYQGCILTSQLNINQASGQQ